MWSLTKLGLFSLKKKLSDCVQLDELVIFENQITSTKISSCLFQQIVFVGYCSLVAVNLLQIYSQLNLLLIQGA